MGKPEIPVVPEWFGMVHANPFDLIKANPLFFSLFS